MIPSSALWRPLATFWASVLHLSNKLINTFCHSGSLGGEGRGMWQPVIMPQVNPVFTQPKRKAGLSWVLWQWTARQWPLWFRPQLGHPGRLLYNPRTARCEGEAVHGEHGSPGLGGQGAGTGKCSLETCQAHLRVYMLKTDLGSRLGWSSAVFFTFVPIWWEYSTVRRNAGRFVIIEE